MAARTNLRARAWPRFRAPSLGSRGHFSFRPAISRYIQVSGTESDLNQNIAEVSQIEHCGRLLLDFRSLFVLNARKGAPYPCSAKPSPSKSFGPSRTMSSGGAPMNAAALPLLRVMPETGHFGWDWLSGGRR